MTAILDWAGCATFRLTIDDLIVFLDAYLDRSPAAVPTGFSADAVERAESAHDAATVCLGDLGVDWHQQRSRMDAALAGLAGLAESDPGVRDYVASHNALASRGDGGALAYLIDTPEGSLFYTDTAGCWTPVLGRLRPDVAILGAQGRGNVDGDPVQGSLAGFIARQAELLSPARLLLGHHDDWMPGLTSALDTTSVRGALAERTPGIDFVEIGYHSGYPLFSSTGRASTTETGGRHE